MTDPRKVIFDALRQVAGTISADDVLILDTALDQIGIARATQSQWMMHAAPLIQEFEGYARKMADGRVCAYPDPATGGAPWTIGWGSTGPDVNKGTIWTEEQASTRFLRDLSTFANGVEHAIGNAATTDQQLAAMVSLAYNVGLTNFRKSTLLKLHMAGDFSGAKAQFARWNLAAGKVMPGLIRRRAAEAALYGAKT